MMIMIIIIIMMMMMMMMLMVMMEWYCPDDEDYHDAWIMMTMPNQVVSAPAPGDRTAAMWTLTRKL